MKYKEDAKTVSDYIKSYVNGETSYSTMITAVRDTVKKVEFNDKYRSRRHS